MATPPGYLRHVMGRGKFLEFASNNVNHSATAFKSAKHAASASVANLCKEWAEYITAASTTGTIPDREQNAMKIAADITARGNPIICMEMGHINSADDFSHSHVQMLIPLDMVPTYKEELETHGELQVYFIDAAEEVRLIKLEHYMNAEQKNNHTRDVRKIALIAKVGRERYYNFSGLRYPLSEVYALLPNIRDEIANNYVCMSITFIEASPETRIDFILSPLRGIVC